MSEAVIVQPWAPPAIDAPSRRANESRREPSSSSPSPDPGAGDAAYARGFEQGRQAAEQLARERLQALETEVARMHAIANALAAPLADLDDVLEVDLTRLVCTIARQVVRREVRLEPGQIIAVLREALPLLPASARDVRVHLHPDDAALVQAHLSAAHGERAWVLVEDATLERGGCLVRSGPSEIDLRIEARIAAVVSAALGDERRARGESPDAPGVAP
jgi:flagellar assembly protein FliH